MPGLPERNPLSAAERLLDLPGRLVILNVAARPAPSLRRRRLRSLEDRLARIGSRGFTSGAERAIVTLVNGPGQVKQHDLGSG